MGDGEIGFAVQNGSVGIQRFLGGEDGGKLFAFYFYQLRGLYRQRPRFSHNDGYAVSGAVYNFFNEHRLIVGQMISAEDVLCREHFNNAL
ncbi:hypothetical protein SDC9_203137 [bioreactor metagenome]|uniref:Uncharacterized protein n=1 Tax=bioreactor metagenome TaxID=1076179 RepID=A0A645IVK4_9ZZZZ